MSGQVLRRIVPFAVMAALAGCTTPSPLETAKTDDAAGTGQQTASNTTVIQGSCPQIFLRDGTAFYRTYARGAKDDPTKVVFQASIAETTRSCTMNETAMTITVVAQGRLVTGPEGKSGKLVMPIRVAVTDGPTTLYSELTRFEAEIPAGTGSTQFVFRKENVAIPGGAGKQAKIFIGFDEGPYDTK